MFSCRKFYLLSIPPVPFMFYTSPRPEATKATRRLPANTGSFMALHSVFNHPLARHSHTQRDPGPGRTQARGQHRRPSGAGQHLGALMQGGVVVYAFTLSNVIILLNQNYGQHCAQICVIGGSYTAGADLDTAL